MVEKRSAPYKACMMAAVGSILDKTLGAAGRANAELRVTG